MKSHLIIVAAVLIIANTSPAAPVYWFGTADSSTEGGIGTWDTANNHFSTSASGPANTPWDNTTNPGDPVFESTPGTVTVSGITLNGTLTDNSGYTFSGTALTIGAGAAFNVASGNTLTMSSVVTGTGGVLTKNGLGTFIQNANNAYTGGTVINDGTWVIATASGTFGTAGAGNVLTINNVSGAVTLVRGSQSGATSPACGVVQQGDLILGDGSPMSLNVAFVLPVANSATWQIKGGNRKITTGANSAAGVWVLGNGHAAGHIIEDGSARTLTFDGAGTVTINGENDIMGGVTITAGTVRIGASIVNPFGNPVSSALTLAGGTLSQAANHTGGAISNAVNVTANSSITTSATAAGQVLEFSGNITSSGGTTLTLVDAAASGSFLPRFSGPATFSGMIAINNNGGSGTATTTLNLFNTTGNDQTFADVISGTGALTRSAASPGAGTAGTSYMNAANTYSGGTTLIDGAIGVGIDSVGVYPSAVTSGALGTGTITVSPSSSTCLPTLFSSGAGYYLNNGINLANNTAPLIVNGDQTLTLLGPITGPGILRKSGPGQLRILAPGGGFNTYSGGTIIYGGSIACDNSSNGTDPSVNFGAYGTGTITLAGGGLSGLSPENLRVIGNHILFASSVATLGDPGGTTLVLAGNVDLNGYAPTITVDNNTHSTTISGQIIGNGGFTKAGPSTLTLTHANTYSDGTTVSVGTLDVQKDGGLGSGNVAVASGATLRLTAGTANTYINSGATLTLNGASPLVKLDFTGTPNSISALYFGAVQQASGTWGAIGSGANHESALFTGTGMLIVGGVVYGQINNILSIVDNGGGNFTLSLQGSPWAEYSLVSSADVTAVMNTWATVAGSTQIAPAPSGQWMFPVSAAGPQFYRLKATNPAP